MTLEVTILNGVDVLAQTLNAVASFTSNESWFSLMKIAEIIGIFAAGLAYLKSQDLKVMFYWILGFVLINTILLTPKERIVITDLANPTVIKSVDNVPLGVGLPLYLTTSIGNVIARKYDIFFSQPEDIRYTKTGILFGQRLLESSFNMTLSDKDMNANLESFIKSCLIERQMISNNFSWSNLKNSTELVSMLYQGKEADFMAYRSGNSRGFMNCRDAGKTIAQAVQKESQEPSIFTKLLKSAGFSPVTETTSLEFKNNISGIQEYFMGQSASASQIYTQNILVNAFRRTIDRYPTSLDGTADLVATASEQSLTKMKLAHLSSYQVAGHMLPALHTVLLVLMVGIFPIMVLALFIRELSWNVVKNYMTILFSLMMWPVLFAIFNSIINTLQYQVMHGEAFTISNMDKLKENVSSVAGVAMWLMLSIPFISFRLVTSLGQNLASAGSYLGNALSSATSSDAANTAAGNYNWANMQMNNVNGNKVDLNSVYKSGQQTVQKENGALITTTADGGAVINSSEAVSNVPFTINNRDTLLSSLSKAATMANDKISEARQSYMDAKRFVDDVSTSFAKNIGKNVNVGNDANSGVKSAIDFALGYSNSAEQGSSASSNRRSDTTREESRAFEHSKGVKNSIDASLGFNVAGNGGGLKGSYSVVDNLNDRTSKGSKVNVGLDTGDKIAKNESWRDDKRVSDIIDISENDINSIRDSDVRNLVRNLQTGLLAMKESSSTISHLESQKQSISETANLVRSNQLEINENMTQEFIAWGKQNLSSNEFERLFTNFDSASIRAEREALISKFTEDKANEILMGHDQNVQNVLNQFNSSNVHSRDGLTESYNSRSATIENEAYQSGVPKQVEQHNFESKQLLIDQEKDNAMNRDRKVKDNADKQISTHKKN